MNNIMVHMLVYIRETSQLDMWYCHGLHNFTTSSRQSWKDNIYAYSSHETWRWTVLFETCLVL